MSNQESLYSLVHEQFREAFGKPTHILGGGEQWTLTPTTHYRSRINVLLNGKNDKPNIWVFDPHDGENGVRNTIISKEHEIGDFIKLIQARLDFANLHRDKRPPK